MAAIESSGLVLTLSWWQFSLRKHVTMLSSYALSCLIIDGAGFLSFAVHFVIKLGISLSAHKVRVERNRHSNFLHRK